MQTKRIYDADQSVQDFIAHCDNLGYKNNNSLKAMKWDWCLENGAWFATYKEDKIISLSGIHKFENGYRALFRGAQLESRPCGLNKYHMQSYCFAEQLPLQIEFAGVYPVYITTNVEHDASGRMNRVDKMFHKLAVHKLVNFVEEKEVYYTLQNIWRLNIRNYNLARYGSQTPPANW